MGPLIFLIIGTIILIISFVGRVSNNIEQTKSAIENTAQTIKKENIIVSKELNYSVLLVQKMHFVVDDTNKKVHIFYMNNPKIEIPYEKIMGCEIYQNGTVVGGVNRAIAGGLIAGGAGAVVGAITPKKKEQSIGLRFSQNDLQHPEIVFSLIDPYTDGESAKNAKLCQEAINFANEVVATIKVIIKQMENMPPNNSIRKQNIVLSPIEKNIEEMKKYKELLDMGIITQEEFDKKKKDLL